MSRATAKGCIVDCNHFKLVSCTSRTVRVVRARRPFFSSFFFKKVEMGNTAGTQIPRTPRQPQFVREHPVATMGLMGCGLLVALGILFRLVLMSLSIILWMLKARNLVNYVVQPDCLAQRKYRLLLHQFAQIGLSAHASRNAKEKRFESFLQFSLLHSLFLLQRSVVLTFFVLYGVVQAFNNVAPSHCQEPLLPAD